MLRPSPQSLAHPPAAPGVDAGVAAPRRRSVPYLPEIEGLRGVAMLLVYAFHVDSFVTRAAAGEVSPLFAFVRAGNTGVCLFFVLSGFLLSLPFIAGLDRGRPIETLGFYRRRALRILPLYYFAVVVGTVFTSQRLADLLRALPYLVFLNSFAGWTKPIPNYGAVWWSLATEAQFYLLLPLLPLLLRSRVGRWTGVALVVGYAAAYAAFLAGDVHTRSVPGTVILRLSLFGQGPAFLFGMGVAAVHVRFGDRIRQRLQAIRWVRVGGGDLLLAIVVLALGVLLQWQVRVTSSVSEAIPMFGWHALEAASWAAILAIVMLVPLHSARMLRGRVLVHLGVLSYSMYMWHVPMVRYGLYGLRHGLGIYGGLGWTPINVVIVAGLTLVCLGVSELTYRFIELPFLRRKARLAEGTARA